MLGRISRAASSTVATTATGKRASQQTLVVPIGTTTAVRNRFKFAHLPPQFRQKMRAEHEMPGYVPTLMQFLRSQSKAPQNPMKPQKKYKKTVHAMNPFVTLNRSQQIEMEALAEKLIAKAESDKQQAISEGTAMQAELTLIEKQIDDKAARKLKIAATEERQKKKAVIAARRAKKEAKSPKKVAEDDFDAEDHDDAEDVAAEEKDVTSQAQNQTL